MIAAASAGGGGIENNEQLPSPPPLPAPYAMCSAAESTDRQLHLELSEFESTPSTYNLGPRHRKANPRLVVKKYRRSAAGGGVMSCSSPTAAGEGRSIGQLSMTIDHLLGYVLPNQRTSTPQWLSSLCYTLCACIHVRCKKNQKCKNDSCLNVVLECLAGKGKALGPPR